MGSFKGNGRGDGPKRRQDDARRRRQGRPDLESLEERRLLTGGGSTSGSPWVPTNTNLYDTQNGPLANMGENLISAYRDFINYEKAGGTGTFKPTESSEIMFLGTSVGIDVRGSGSMTTYAAALGEIGMTVTGMDAKQHVISGWLPLQDLPAVASEAQTLGGNPIYRPTYHYQGTANNEGDTTMGTATARTTFNVDGSGQKVGVLSDSVNQYQGGLSESVSTGNLPNNVQVIQDATPDSVDPNSSNTDEGRAMLEDVYDVAPGASLAFATAGENDSNPGQVGFANNILALQAAGATEEVDDVGFPDEPYYQDGIPSAAINQVVADGVDYFSAIGNAADSGYESQFRGVTATVTGVGTGTFQNFNPSGSTVATTIGINVYQAGPIGMQFDQPFFTTSGVTSNVQIFLLQNGTVVGSGTSNTIANQEPIQFISDSSGNMLNVQPGVYQVAIQVVSGPNPGHVLFYEAGEGGFSVDHQYGSTGGTYYPSAIGHSGAPETIGVGAVPWWGAEPYSDPSPVTNEPYSSFGPELNLFTSTGTPTTPTVVQSPEVSAPDFINTSFFIPGQIIDTSTISQFVTANPPYTGEAATTFTVPDTTTNQAQDLPTFSGTSAACENVAALVALMKDVTPTIDQAQIVTALEATATPLNGSTQGTYNAQGGYGLVNAVAAINEAKLETEKLEVVSITPGSGNTVTSVPGYLQVQFSQPVNINSLSSSDLLVAGANGAFVSVGQPVGVDSTTFPTIVRFPIGITPVPGTIANGVYSDEIVPGAIVGENGATLAAAYNDHFFLEQTTAPTVVNTTLNNRIVTIQFSEALNASSVNSSSVYVYRNNGVNNTVLNSNSINLAQLPGATFSYNGATFTVTINLTGVPQSSLPTDQYGIAALASITDAVGNHLNGSFTGVFPSGVTPSLPNGTIFNQPFGVITLTAPTVTFLNLAASSDSGIPNDNNTNIRTPSLSGQVTSSFPGSLGGLLVYAEFNGISHTGVPSGGLDLNVGANGRGYVGQYDIETTTNALGQFTINYPAGVSPLQDGEQLVRVVVVGQPDQPPFPGLSSVQETAFRVAGTLPYVGADGSTPATSIPEDANINSLVNLTLNIIDPVLPQALGSPFAVSTKIAIPALNPTSADNVKSYRLYRLNGTSLVDESAFITGATFTSTSARVFTSDPYTGQVQLTFAPGLPAGSYRFYALSSAYGQGLSDAAGNPFGGYSNEPMVGGTMNYELDFNLQPTPTYITNYQALTPDAASSLGYDVTSPRANYEIPVAGVSQSVEAPPTIFAIDFSNPLNPNTNYNNAVELVRSANTATSLPDGDFGDLGITNSSGYTAINGITVTLQNSVTGAVFGQYGYDNQLIIRLPAGLSLPADYYRLYFPNSGPSEITDVYGNQLDGEFLGYLNAAGKYVDQLPNGTVRGAGGNEISDLSGDGTPGGAFMTGFVVVPNGDIIYARADAVYNPQIPSQTPNGSQALPYPVLAPEAVPTAANGGDLNSNVNAGTNFNLMYDYSGDGQFEPSAFFAAQEHVEENGGPVVIIAEASIPTFDPTTRTDIQKPFVLEAPNPSGNAAATNANDASAAIPALTTLAFQPGTILKMQNAALLVQNQGSALQIDGGGNPGQGVTITSYLDNSIGGETDGNPNSVPSPGDYGGILFRNYSQAALPGSTTGARTTLFPGQIPITGDPTTDDRLKGQFTQLGNPTSQADAVSGADDIMSYISFLTEKYAGGAVPTTIGYRYDGITLQNSRPTIVNSTIADAGGVGSAQAGLSADVDSLRADDVAQGPLLRNDTFINNGLNGIYIRAEIASGLAEPTNAVAYPINPSSKGGSANYVLDDPYPYLLTSRLIIGSSLNQETGGGQSSVADRLYVDPGMLVKFELGAGILVEHSGSLNVGDTTYIKQFDADDEYGPTYAATLPNGEANPLAGQVDPNFVTNSTQLAQVVFTSLYDDTATTTYTDPVTGVVSTVVAALPATAAGAGDLQPTSTNVPAASRWGGITLEAGSIDVINSADFRYGGGTINTPTGSQSQHVLEINPGDEIGANIMITNNVFTSNLDVPINMNPNALEAGDAKRPLLSGDPFIHGNVFENNGVDAVGIQGGTDGINEPNLTVNSVWTGSDFTYVLRDSIVLGGDILQKPVNGENSLLPEPKAAVTLTLQSTLAGTILADGSTVSAPGVPLIIKLENVGSQPTTETSGAIPTAVVQSSYAEGAGFLVGVDNGVDPTADSLVDPGAYSQLRILGIGANQTTGQSRVPVIITSIHDSTVGTTVDNVVMDQAIPGDTTAPKAGDGGVIDFGANSLTTYDLQDPRSGSRIDNADISYLTRIEQQGGGLFQAFDTTGAGTAFTTGTAYTQELGQYAGTSVGYEDQFNQPKQLSISDSNLSAFSDVAFRANPGYGSLLIVENYTSTAPIVRDTAIEGEATHTYFVNDTISNMPNTAIEIISATANNTGFPMPAEGVFLNNTFYNDGGGIATFSPTYNLLNDLAHTATMIMDNIFSNITNTAITETGQNYGSEIQYNLFNQVGTETVLTNNNTATTNDQPILGNPEFRDAATGNFFLLPNSAAIDQARSEIGPDVFGDMLYPVYTVSPGNPAAETRTEPNGPLATAVAGDVNAFGGLYDIFFNEGLGGGQAAPYAVDIVTLPGEPVSERGFPDQFIPVLPSSGLGTSGASSNAATYDYVAISGERDQAGNLRVKDPNSSNVGFGSRPFFDLGAFEYIIQNPPVVESVISTSTVNGVTTSSNLYGVGTIAGTNVPPDSIEIHFNQQLNPATINGNSVILLASGGTGVFGGGSSHAISLAGDLSFNSTTDILTIDTSGIFNNPATENDEYRIILKGTGSAVIRNTDGLALDGLNLDGSGNQLALPSGTDQFPGSDFQVTFTIDTHSPSVVSGTFELAPSSDSSGGRDITNITKPTFTGTITDTFPPANPLVGQTVEIDISTLGNGIFNLIDAGTGTTNANGSFSITLSTPLPNTPDTIGTNGVQGTTGSNHTIARVRIINSAGNASNSVNDPLINYINEGAATFFQVDTTSPTVEAFSPAANTVATTNASGQVVVTATFSKNLKDSSLNPSSILVERTGGTGSFTNPIAVPIVDSSFTTSYSTAAATLGEETVSFAIAGPLPNDQYEVIFKGTGSSTITDPAKNPLSGAFTGTFPTGGGSNTGSDFVSGPFTVYQATAAQLIYVEAGSTGTGTEGTRENPFPTITAGMDAALIGDDVLVLPGTYREDVTVKPGVRLLSASLDSTDTAFTPGSPFQTLIYGVNSTDTILESTDNNIITVNTTGSVAGVPTEVSGFSIISPLVGNTVTGPIDPTNVAVEAVNSNLELDRNNIVNGGIGVVLASSGTKAPTSEVFDNVIAGNITGIIITDQGSTASLSAPFQVVNNTIVDNTTGLFNSSTTPNSLQAYVLNNIFASNHDLTTARAGTGIASAQVNTLGVGFNLFYQNGASASPSSQAAGVFGQFNPADLSATPDALNNILGNPEFAQPEDPRPNGDTPPVFFNYANYDLTASSPAINAANGSAAPATDFLYRGAAFISGHGFPNTGPASIGAYYYKGLSTTPGGTGTIFGGGTTTTGTGTTSSGSSSTGGSTGTSIHTGSVGSNSGGISAAAVAGSSVTNSTVGGGIALGSQQFDVIASSLSSNGTAHAADGLSTSVASLVGPSYIDLNFSDTINPATVSPTDLVLSGSGLDASDPAHATSLAWIDDHAIRFFLTGGYNNSGTVNISIPQGSMTNNVGASLDGFKDSFQVIPASAATASTTAAVTPTTLLTTVAPVIQPVAAASPIAIPLATKAGSSKHGATTQQPTAKELKLAAKAKAAKLAAEAKAAKHEAQVKAAHEKASRKAVKKAK